MRHPAQNTGATRAGNPPERANTSPPSPATPHYQQIADVIFEVRRLRDIEQRRAEWRQEFEEMTG